MDFMESKEMMEETHELKCLPVATVELVVEELFYELVEGPVKLCDNPPLPVVWVVNEVQEVVGSLDSVEADIERGIETSDQESDEHFRKSFDDLLKEVSEFADNIEERKYNDDDHNACDCINDTSNKLESVSNIELDKEGNVNVGNAVDNTNSFDSGVTIERCHHPGITVQIDENDCDVEESQSVAINELRNQLNEFLSVAQENKSLKASLASSVDEMDMENIVIAQNYESVCFTDSESMDTSTDMLSLNFDSLSDDVFEVETNGKSAYPRARSTVPSHINRFLDRTLAPQSDSLSSEIEAIVNSYKTGFLSERYDIEGFEPISAGSYPDTPPTAVDTDEFEPKSGTPLAPLSGNFKARQGMFSSDDSSAGKESWTTGSILSSVSLDSGSYYTGIGVDLSEESDIERHEQFILMDTKPCIRRSISLNGGFYKGGSDKVAIGRRAESMNVIYEGQGTDATVEMANAEDDAVEDEICVQTDVEDTESEQQNNRLSMDLEPLYSEFMQTYLEIESGSGPTLQPIDVDDFDNVHILQDDMNNAVDELNTNSLDVCNDTENTDITDESAISKAIEEEHDQLVDHSDVAVIPKENEADTHSATHDEQSSGFDTNSALNSENNGSDITEECKTGNEDGTVKHLELGDNASTLDNNYTSNVVSPIVFLDSAIQVEEVCNEDAGVEELAVNEEETAVISLDSAVMTDKKLEICLENTAVYKDHAEISRCSGIITSDRTEFSNTKAIITLDCAEVTSDRSVFHDDKTVVSFDKIMIKDCITKEQQEDIIDTEDGKTNTISIDNTDTNVLDTSNVIEPNTNDEDECTNELDSDSKGETPIIHPIEVDVIILDPYTKTREIETKNVDTGNRSKDSNPTDQMELNVDVLKNKHFDKDKTIVTESSIDETNTQRKESDKMITDNTAIVVSESSIIRIEDDNMEEQEESNTEEEIKYYIKTEVENLNTTVTQTTVILDNLFEDTHLNSPSGSEKNESTRNLKVENDAGQNKTDGITKSSNDVLSIEHQHQPSIHTSMNITMPDEDIFEDYADVFELNLATIEEGDEEGIYQNEHELNDTTETAVFKQMKATDGLIHKSCSTIFEEQGSIEYDSTEEENVETKDDTVASDNDEILTFDTILYTDTVVDSVCSEVFKEVVISEIVEDDPHSGTLEFKGTSVKTESNEVDTNSLDINHKEDCGVEIDIADKADDGQIEEAPLAHMYKETATCATTELLNSYPKTKTNECINTDYEKENKDDVDSIHSSEEQALICVEESQSYLEQEQPVQVVSITNMSEVEGTIINKEDPCLPKTSANQVANSDSATVEDVLVKNANLSYISIQQPFVNEVDNFDIDLGECGDQEVNLCEIESGTTVEELISDTDIVFNNLEMTDAVIESEYLVTANQNEIQREQLVVEQAGGDEVEPAQLCDGAQVYDTVLQSEPGSEVLGVAETHSSAVTVSVDSEGIGIEYVLVEKEPVIELVDVSIEYVDTIDLEYKIIDANVSLEHVVTLEEIAIENDILSKVRECKDNVEEHIARELINVSHLEDSSVIIEALTNLEQAIIKCEEKIYSTDINVTEQTETITVNESNKLVAAEHVSNSSHVNEDESVNTRTQRKQGDTDLSLRLESEITCRPDYVDYTSCEDSCIESDGDSDSDRMLDYLISQDTSHGQPKECPEALFMTRDKHMNVEDANCSEQVREKVVSSQIDVCSNKHTDHKLVTDVDLKTDEMIADSPTLPTDGTSLIKEYHTITDTTNDDLVVDISNIDRPDLSMASKSEKITSGNSLPKEPVPEQDVSSEIYLEVYDTDVVSKSGKETDNQIESKKDILATMAEDILTDLNEVLDNNLSDVSMSSEITANHSNLKEYGYVADKTNVVSNLGTEQSKHKVHTAKDLHSGNELETAHLDQKIVKSESINHEDDRMNGKKGIMSTTEGSNDTSDAISDIVDEEYVNITNIKDKDEDDTCTTSEQLNEQVQKGFSDDVTKSLNDGDVTETAIRTLESESECVLQNEFQKENLDVCIHEEEVKCIDGKGIRNSQQFEMNSVPTAEATYSDYEAKEPMQQSDLESDGEDSGDSSSSDMDEDLVVDRMAFGRQDTVIAKEVSPKSKSRRAKLLKAKHVDDPGSMDKNEKERTIEVEAVTADLSEDAGFILANNQTDVSFDEVCGNNKDERLIRPEQKDAESVFKDDGGMHTCTAMQGDYGVDIIIDDDQNNPYEQGSFEIQKGEDNVREPHAYNRQKQDELNAESQNEDIRKQYICSTNTQSHINKKEVEVFDEDHPHEKQLPKERKRKKLHKEDAEKDDLSQDTKFHKDAKPSGEVEQKVTEEEVHSHISKSDEPLSKTKMENDQHVGDTEKADAKDDQVSEAEKVKKSTSKSGEVQKRHRRNRSISNTFMSKMSSEISKRPEYSGKGRRSYIESSDEEIEAEEIDKPRKRRSANLEAVVTNQDLETCATGVKESNDKQSKHERVDKKRGKINQKHKADDGIKVKSMDQRQEQFAYPSEQATMANMDDLAEYYTDTSSTLEDVRDKLEEWIDSQSDDSRSSSQYRKKKEQRPHSGKEQQGNSNEWKEQQLYAMDDDLGMSESDLRLRRATQRKQKTAVRDPKVKPQARDLTQAHEAHKQARDFDVEHERGKKPEQKIYHIYSDDDGVKHQMKEQERHMKVKERIRVESGSDVDDYRKGITDESGEDVKPNKVASPGTGRIESSLYERRMNRHTSSSRDSTSENGSESYRPDSREGQMTLYGRQTQVKKSYESGFGNERSKMGRSSEMQRIAGYDRGLSIERIQSTDTGPQGRQNVGRYESNIRNDKPLDDVSNVYQSFESIDRHSSANDSLQDSYYQDGRKSTKPSKHDFIDLPRKSPEEKYVTGGKVKSRSILTEPHIRKFGDIATKRRQEKRPISRAGNYSFDSSTRGSFDDGVNRYDSERRKSRDLRSSFSSQDEDSDRFGRLKRGLSVSWGSSSELKGSNSVKSKLYSGQEYKYKDVGQLRNYENHQLIIKQREGNKNLISYGSGMSGVSAQRKNVDQCKSVPKTDKGFGPQDLREIRKIDKPYDRSSCSDDALQEKNYNQYTESRGKPESDILYSEQVKLASCNQNNGKAFYQPDRSDEEALRINYQNPKENRRQKIDTSSQKITTSSQKGVSNVRSGGVQTKMRIPVTHGNTRKGEGDRTSLLVCC